jgi:hypothetical protein
VASTLQQLRDPYAVLSFADRAATTTLLGRPAETAEEVLDEVAGVTRDEVAALVPGYLTSLLLGVPRGATWNDEMPLLGMPTEPRPEGGVRHRFRNYPASREQLVLTDSAVAVGEKDRWQGVALADLAGVLSRPDGGRTLVRHDGWSISVEPTMWSGGAAAVQHIDRIVPTDKVIPVPALAPEAVPRPLPFAKRWLAWGGMILIIGFGLLLVAAGIAFQQRFLVFGAIAYFVSLWVNLAKERRKQT